MATTADHIAIVTGAGTGIGAATARRLLDSGARVALFGRRRELLDEVADGNDRALVVSVDISDSAAVATAVATVADRFGAPTFLVNAAGIDGPAPLADLTPQIWDQQIAINLSGSFYVSREVALRMSPGGSIVNLGSELSWLGMGMFVHYCASKFGVIGLTKAMALELAGRVRVNVVCPGPVDTPMMDAELEWFADPEATRQGAIDRVPMKRFATADEVADVILFVGLQAGFATGASFSVDGGTTAGG